MKKLFFGTGRRKTAISKVFITRGGGIIKINNINYINYFKDKKLLYLILLPLITTNNINNFDIFVKTKGGGLSCQAEATQLGIARGLVKYNTEYRLSLKRKNFLIRDSRKIERKKVGLKKARKKGQFSKR